MSIQRQDQSPQFRIKQKIKAKVNYNSKLLPLDFFPKTVSSSPKKRSDIPSSKQLLAQWFNRQDYNDKPQKIYKRIPNHKISIKKIPLCQLKKQSTSKQRQEDKKYCYNPYTGIKQQIENLKYSNNPQKRSNHHLDPKKSLVKFIKNNSAVKIVNQAKSRPRIIRSQGKQRKRYDNSQQKTISTIKNCQQRLSLKQFPKKCSPAGPKRMTDDIGVGFDGFITFSRFK